MNGPSLYHFSFMTVYLCIGAPHSREAYSSCGRTMVLYAASRKPVCLVLMFLVIKPRFIDVRADAVYMCVEN